MPQAASRGGPTEVTVNASLSSRDPDQTIPRFATIVLPKEHRELNGLATLLSTVCAQLTSSAWFPAMFFLAYPNVKVIFIS